MHGRDGVVSLWIALPLTVPAGCAFYRLSRSLATDVQAVAGALH